MPAGVRPPQPGLPSGQPGMPFPGPGIPSATPQKQLSQQPQQQQQQRLSHDSDAYQHFLAQEKARTESKPSSQPQQQQQPQETRKVGEGSTIPELQIQCHSRELRSTEGS